MKKWVAGTDNPAFIKAGAKREAQITYAGAAGIPIPKTSKGNILSNSKANRLPPESFKKRLVSGREHVIMINRTNVLNKKKRSCQKIDLRRTISLWTLPRPVLL